jgi:hypothetical protein
MKLRIIFVQVTENKFVWLIHERRAVIILNTNDLTVR